MDEKRTVRLQDYEEETGEDSPLEAGRRGEGS